MPRSSSGGLGRRPGYKLGYANSVKMGIDLTAILGYGQSQGS